MRKRQRTWKSPVVIFLLVFCTVLVGSTFATRAMARSNKVEEATRFVANWQDLARIGHSAGRPVAAVSVVVFADYQCAGCAALHGMLHTAARLMPEELRVVTRHYPLSIHKHAMVAANAAECAGEQGRFAQMEDALYSLQDSIGITSWSTFAMQAGVRDSTAFNRCVRDDRFASTVERDHAVAKGLALKGTPTYLVNGTLYFGAPSEGQFLQQLRDVASTARIAKLDSTQVGGRVKSSGVPVRKWLAPLSLERSIVGESGDELLIPGSIAATPRGELVVFDYGAMEVRAFARDGRSLWRAGQKGAGPGEFLNVMDLKVRSNGEVALLDMANLRITALSPTGKMKRTVPIKLNSSRFVATADTNSYTMVGGDSATLWNSVSLDGETVRRIDAPASLIARNGLVREQFTAPLGNKSVIAYRWTDKILVLQTDGAIESIIDGIEPIKLPGIAEYPASYGEFKGTVARVDPKAIPAALSVATNGRQIFVLYAGASEHRGRIIDVYDAETQRYAGSYLLPHGSQEIAVLPDGAIVTLRMEPIPALDVWVDAAGSVPTKTRIAGRGVRSAK